MAAKDTWEALFGERERCQETYGQTGYQCRHWQGHAGCCVAKAPNANDDDPTFRWIVPGRVETWRNNPIFKENRHAG
jgi:hypothetical protein